MRVHSRRALKYALIACSSLFIIHILRTVTPRDDTGWSGVVGSQLVTVTMNSSELTNRTAYITAIDWWSPMTTSRLTTPLPSYIHPRPAVDYRKIRQPNSLLASNFSPNMNEWHREKFVVRHSYASDSVWWWGSLSETTLQGALRAPRDRILQQLYYMPESYYRRRLENISAARLKTIYVTGGSRDVEQGQGKFIREKCLVDACVISRDPRDANTSHMRLLYSHASFVLPSDRVKPPGQIWVMYLLESPAVIGEEEFRDVGDLINWTATFRWDSTIVTPYAKFVPLPPATTADAVVGSDLPVQRSSSSTNHAAGKTKLVAWFVSNCHPRNERGAYVEELSRYVPVEVFGACGKPTCRRFDDNCWLRLRHDYKFYLSFENSNCDYYITEKLFDNALSNGVVPIVMGGRRRDYELAAPPHSYIHVEEFSSARDLADYLVQLNQSDELYNEYFEWKGMGQFMNTKFWCRLCALLHDESKPVMWYSDFNQWWSHRGTCRRDRWDV